MEAILSLFFNFFCSTLEKSLRQKIAESGFNGSNVRSQERQVTLYCTENSPNRVFISLYEKSAKIFTKKSTLFVAQCGLLGLFMVAAGQVMLRK